MYMQKLFFNYLPLSTGKLSVISLALRVLTGGAMLSHGIPKLMAFATLKETFPDPLGVGSMVSLMLSIGAEVGCSLLLILGLFTRLAVLPLAFTMLMAFFVIHSADPFSTRELAMMYFMIYVAIFSLGSGNYSADRLIGTYFAGRTTGGRV